MIVTFVVALAILYLIGVTFFLYREVRRSPGPMQWGRTPRWMKRVRVTLAAIPLLLGCLAIWAFLIEPSRLVTYEETIQVTNWPRELDGLRIAVLSDIHAGGWCIDEKKLRLIVERTNQLQPEMIVMLGDFIAGHDATTERLEPEQFAPILKELRAPLGVYSVLGNHDWWWNGRRVWTNLEANNIEVLEDEVVEIKTRGTSFWLVGLADLWTRPQRVASTIGKTPQGAPVIALTHNPDIFPRVPERVQLLLAGHTHGGQVRLPFIGTVIEPSNYGQRYVKGHVIENNHHLFVTTGIGTSIIHVRFGVPPEIVLLTIKS